MEINIKESHVVAGDIMVTTDNTVRMIVETRRQKYGALNLSTGELIFEHESIKELLQEYDVLRIIKNKDMVLSER